MNSTESEIRKGSMTYPGREREFGGKIEVCNLSKEELEVLEGVINGGRYWVTIENGRLIFKPTTQPLPSPAEDVEMLPFWRRVNTADESRKLKRVNFNRATEMCEHDSPHFAIQHLCGYGYTPENYKAQATLLESFGFECLRSRRGLDGRYWEVWYLPGLWSAEGELKKALGEKTTGKEATDKAINFLCRKARFGTLDVSVQRAAMPVPD